MKRALALTALLFCTAPAFAQRTWIEVDTGTYIDMKSVVVKDGVAYFNIGFGDGTRLPRDGYISSSSMNCRQRTNRVGVYVPSPADHEKWEHEGKQISAEQLEWGRQFNNRLEMVCPANITSKDFKESLTFD